jgi:uncharacterized protein
LLYNKTSKKTIMNKIKIAKTFYSKFKGLMFESKKKFDYALVFEFTQKGTTINAIHMLFVFFSIDAVFLNENKKVIEIKKNLKPWTLFYAPKKPAKYLIELPEGKSNEIKLNDEIEWN